ncbi:KilA-N domain-containing protein [Candidatus Saccharibacteria bacterium]|nr:KilA-N domain-containing protein [Candidatus Saccharibacteria bacterium]
MVKKSTKLIVEGTEIVVARQNDKDYISLTDMATFNKDSEARFVIFNWMSTFATLNYLATWEKYYNPNFNRMGFHTVKNPNGRLLVSPSKWIEETNAIGMFVKMGRYGGGVFAHKDIAFEFATWLSPEFKFYLVKEFERLKEQEQKQLSSEWNLQRTLAKINYRIHTDAIKENLIPRVVSASQKKFTYANEADLLNVALFGQTAAEWRAAHPRAEGNVRDEATLEQLVVLSNLESINALLIREGLSQGERLARLNATAIAQLKSLLEHDVTKKIDGGKK